eukprot:74399-Amphidinium_carterae.1
MITASKHTDADALDGSLIQVDGLRAKNCEPHPNPPVPEIPKHFQNGLKHRFKLGQHCLTHFKPIFDLLWTVCTTGRKSSQGSSLLSRHTGPCQDINPSSQTQTADRTMQSVH